MTTTTTILPQPKVSDNKGTTSNNNKNNRIHNNNNNNNNNSNSNNNNNNSVLNTNDPVMPRISDMSKTNALLLPSAVAAATAATSSNMNISNTIANEHNSTTTGASIQPVMNSTQNLTRTMQTDEDFNIRFVNLVRTHKCLYDKKVPEYRNRDNQEKAWLQISIETKESVIHCKERWRNLRACLSRYIKQQNSTDPQHKPYYLTEHMAFLLPFLKSTRNSLDGNSSLVALFQYSQQQEQHQQQCNGGSNNNATITTNAPGLQILVQPQLKIDECNQKQEPYHHHHHQSEQLQQAEVKLSISENEDEETIDAFDAAESANLHLRHNHHSASPAVSDTASANSLQNFIPDVQLSELRTPDGVQHLSFGSNNNGNVHMRGESYDHIPEPKRIKTECHSSEATTTAHLHLYAGEQADMEFFRSILPDIAGLTPQQKRKLKIGILQLIDDVVERYPSEYSPHTTTTTTTAAAATTNTTAPPSQQHTTCSANTRRSSAREYHRK